MEISSNNFNDIEELLKKSYSMEDAGNVQEAERLLRSAAEKGNPEAQYELGMLLGKLGKYDESEEFLCLAADNNDSDAQYALSKLYRGREDMNEVAEDYLWEAANNGNSRARNELMQSEKYDYDDYVRDAWAPNGGLEDNIPQD